MASRNSEHSRNIAKYLSDHKVSRTTGQCPWGCGRAIQNGGDPLLNHLKVCKGPGKGRYRK